MDLSPRELPLMQKVFKLLLMVTLHMLKVSKLKLIAEFHTLKALELYQVAMVGV